MSKKRDIKAKTANQKIDWLIDLCKRTTDTYQQIGFISADMNKIHLTIKQFFELFGDKDYTVINNYCPERGYPSKVSCRQDGYEFFCLVHESDDIAKYITKED